VSEQGALKGQTMADKTIFAHTPSTYPFPPFVNIRRDAEGRHWITVREQGHDGMKVVNMELAPETLEVMAASIMDHLHGLGASEQRGNS